VSGSTSKGSPEQSVKLPGTIVTVLETCPLEACLKNDLEQIATVRESLSAGSGKVDA
jgi:hypothetical protein